VRLTDFSITEEAFDPALKGRADQVFNQERDLLGGVLHEYYQAAA
jgi:hypothetical protein